MSDYIPAEIWPKVLTFLPVKTLLQCTSVCKTWRSIITSSAFISAQLSAARRRPFLLTRNPSTRDPRALSLHSNLDDPFPLSQNLRYPFPSDTPDVSLRVVGAVDGLVCLSDDLLLYTYTLIIWNPSIRRSLHLPMPDFNYDAIGPYHFALGFGFDSAINDYKVVRVVYTQGWNWKEEKHQLPPFVEVCNLRELSWRSLDVADNMEYVITELVWSQCFIHGAIHWIAFKGPENVVLLFDLGDEVFKKMKLPECLVCVDHLRLSVSVIGGLLAVLDRERSVPFTGNDPSRAFKTHIWVKKGYGKGGAWTKIFTVDQNWKLGWLYD